MKRLAITTKSESRQAKRELILEIINLNLAVLMMNPSALDILSKFEIEQFVKNDKSLLSKVFLNKQAPTDI